MKWGDTVKIKRFVAKDMRTALTMIKEELGVDAVIMSNKKIDDGVELMAAVDYHQAQQPNKVEQTQAINTEKTTDSELTEEKISLSATAVANNNLEHKAEVKMPPADSLAALLKRDVQQPQINNVDQVKVEQPASISEQLKHFTDKLAKNAYQPELANEQQITLNPQDEQSFSAGDELDMIEQSPASISVPQSQPSPDEFNALKAEMANIRQLLEHQVAGLMWQDAAQKDPQRAMLVDKLSALGLSEQVADHVAGCVPSHFDEQQSWQLAMDFLAEQIHTTHNDIITRGGVVALIGPTGVGKTTTIAKLAARFAQIHGVDEVALISTDTFRIAGYEQLETYGKIIGCSVQLAKDADELHQLIQQHVKKKLVLIDTAGMGQRDVRLAQHLTTLVANSRVRIRNYLVLAANNQAAVLQENVERFKKIPLAGCIYTKLDECLSAGEIISTAIQNGLPIGYLTDGQRVPEDIKVANAKKLVMLANKMQQQFAMYHLNTRKPMVANIS